MGEPALECNEYEAHVKRNGQGYSWGHQAMYLGPITLLAGRPQHILDVGFGIGFGLHQMLSAKCVATYEGYEPCKEAYDFTAKRFGAHHAVTLHHAPFEGTPKTFDHAFCIEVIEHVPRPEAEILLKRLHDATRQALWLSTPDAAQNDHGVYTEDEMRGLLQAAGFKNVVVSRAQWTKLYICQGD